MRAGILRDRVRVQRFDAAADALGAPERTWVDVTEVNCQILDAADTRIVTEFMAVGTEVAEGTVKITMRELPDHLDFDPAWRLVDADRGTIYEIVLIAPNRTRNELVVTARHGGVKR